MAIKGCASLILADKSGREVKRLEEHNLVTDALKSIWDIPKIGLYSNWNIYNMLGYFLPMHEYALGGIMLLGTAVPEKASGITLPTGFVPIGNAGAAYSGTDIMRGTRNENETVTLDNGVRIVWDFPTDKANGTISCIAVTNRLCGNVGFTQTTAKDGGLIVSLNAVSSGLNSSQVKVITTDYPMVANLEPNIYLGAKTDDSGVTFVKFRLPDPNGLLLTDTIDTAATEPYLSTYVELPYKPSSAVNFFYNPDDNTVYFFNYVNSSDKTTTTINYMGVDATEFTLTTQGSVDIPYTSSVYACAVYGYRLYVNRPDSSDVYTLSGTLERSAALTLSSACLFFVADGRLMHPFILSTNYYFRYVDCDDSVYTYSSTYGCLLTSVDVSSPYALFNQRTNGTNTTYLVLKSNYLATINNLSEPITKDDQHTLKVVYELTNG